MGDLKELTDAQLAASARTIVSEKVARARQAKATTKTFLIAIDELEADNADLRGHNTALAARLAEAEQTIEQRVATIHGLMKIIDGHEAEVEDLAQRCDKALYELAAAQATIARQQTFIKDIEWLGHSFDAGQPYLHCLICQGIKGGTGHTPLCPIPTLLAPPAPEADDAAPIVQK